MSRLSCSLKRIFVSGIVLAGAALAVAPARAQQQRVISGQAFWEGDPGPITDSYWTSGQYKYDPNGYMERNWRDPDQLHLMTVIGNHAGKTNCVFRRRVTITTWDFQHPILRVCRARPKD